MNSSVQTARFRLQSAVHEIVHSAYSQVFLRDLLKEEEEVLSSCRWVQKIAKSVASLLFCKVVEVKALDKHTATYTYIGADEHAKTAIHHTKQVLEMAISDARKRTCNVPEKEKAKAMEAHCNAFADELEKSLGQLKEHYARNGTGSSKPLAIAYAVLEAELHAQSDDRMLVDLVEIEQRISRLISWG